MRFPLGSRFRVRSDGDCERGTLFGEALLGGVGGVRAPRGRLAGRDLLEHTVDLLERKTWERLVSSLLDTTSTVIAPLVSGTRK